MNRMKTRINGITISYIVTTVTNMIIIYWITDFIRYSNRILRWNRKGVNTIDYTVISYQR